MPSATEPSVETFSAKESSQNNFGGLSWGLLCRGRIFAKLATHPVILEVMMMMMMMMMMMIIMIIKTIDAFIISKP